MPDLVTELSYCDALHCDNCSEKSENNLLVRIIRLIHKKLNENRKNSTKTLRNQSQISQTSLPFINVKYRI